MKNIHAYTAVGSFPAFISLNEHNEKFELTVRSHGEGTCGDAARIEMSRNQLIEMAEDILSEFSDKDNADRDPAMDHAQQMMEEAHRN